MILGEKDNNIMNRLKKIISLILIVALCAQNVVFADTLHSSVKTQTLQAQTLFGPISNMELARKGYIKISLCISIE